jgi:hypothetical protein
MTEDVKACPVCKKPLTIAGGIGPYCANKKCPVLDDALLWNEDGTKRASLTVSRPEVGDTNVLTGIRQLLANLAPMLDEMRTERVQHGSGLPWTDWNQEQRNRISGYLSIIDKLATRPEPSLNGNEELVDSLRNPEKPLVPYEMCSLGDLCRLAADEIEQLRAAIAALSTPHGDAK